MSRLQSAAPPNLPAPGVTYDRGGSEQFSSTLRTYFSRVSNNLNAITGRNGGQYIECANALVFSTQTQGLAAADTGYPITFNNVYLDNGVAMLNSSRALVEVNGVYNFQLSAQASSTTASSKNLYLWINRNGTPIGYSARAYTISGSGTKLDLHWAFDIDVEAGQYIEMWWAATDTTVVLEAVAPALPHPGISSAVFTVNFIAPFPVVLPTPP